MVGDDFEKMVRTYDISPDDKTLNLHDVIKDNPGKITKRPQDMPGSPVAIASSANGSRFR